MTPHQLLAELRNQGVALKVRNGQVYGPKTMTAMQRTRVSENKIGLLIALTYVCPTCNQSVVMHERPKYWALECSLDPAHYSELITKQEGTGLGFLSKHTDDCGCSVPVDETAELWESL